MGSVRFTGLAEAGIYNIGVHTLRIWGEAQADRYLNTLEDCCRLLSENPASGRPCDDIRPGLPRIEHGTHVVFYREETGGILVCRVLHQRMLPENQAIDDEDSLR